MAFYYVKSGGAATGDGGRATTLRTGAFGATSTYYDNVPEVWSVPSTSFAAGDSICVSDVHSYSNNGVTYGSWPTSGSACFLISVDDSNQDQMKAGAHETNTGGTQDVTIATTLSFVYVYGMSFTTGDDCVTSFPESRMIYSKCSFEATGTNDNATLDRSYGAYVEYNDCTWKVGNAGAHCTQITNNVHCVIRGGQIDGTGSSPNSFFDYLGSNGGATVLVEGFDWSNLSATGDVINPSGVGNSEQDNINFRAVGCKIASGAALFDGTIAVRGGNRVFEFIGVDSADQYRYLYRDNFGTVIQEKTTHVTASTDMEGSQNFAYKIDTATDCAPASPFVWAGPLSYADMSGAGSDRALLYVTSDSDPTDDEVQMILGWPDSTDDVLLKYGNSGQVAESGVWIPEVFNPGSASYSTASVWTSGKTFERQIPVTASSADATSPFPPRPILVVMKSTGANSLYVNAELAFD